MRFPMQTYTKRGDLPAALRWKAVREFFGKSLILIFVLAGRRRARRPAFAFTPLRLRYAPALS
jgi:hypothetical protein